MITVRVNLEDFRQQLGELYRKAERTVANRAALAAARVLRDAARGLAPVLRKLDRRRQLGALRRSIVAATAKKSGRFGTGAGVVRAYVAVKGKRAVRGRTVDPFYWRFLESGWVPRGPGRRLRGGARARAAAREAARGRKITGYAFFDPAFRRAGPAALRAFEAEFARGFARLKS